MGLGGNCERGHTDIQGAAAEDGEVIVGGGQRTLAGRDRIIALIHSGGGRTAEAGGTGHAAIGQVFVIHKPGQRGCERREDLSVKRLALIIGRHAEVGLVDRQRAAGEGGEVIVGGSQRALGRGDRAVKSCVLGCGRNTTEASRTGHAAGS